MRIGQHVSIYAQAWALVLDMVHSQEEGDHLPTQQLVNARGWSSSTYQIVVAAAAVTLPLDLSLV
jgi:hypothetical protein